MHGSPLFPHVCVAAFLISALAPTYSDAILRAFIVFAGGLALILYSVGAQERFLELLLMSNEGIGLAAGVITIASAGYGVGRLVSRIVKVARSRS